MTLSGKVTMTFTNGVVLLFNKKRRNFWTKGLNHFNRLVTCAFVYINGLNPELFLQWAHLMSLGTDRSAYNHIRALFRL